MSHLVLTHTQRERGGEREKGREGGVERGERGRGKRGERGEWRGEREGGGGAVYLECRECGHRHGDRCPSALGWVGDSV